MEILAPHDFYTPVTDRLSCSIRVRRLRGRNLPANLPVRQERRPAKPKAPGFELPRGAINPNANTAEISPTTGNRLINASAPLASRARLPAYAPGVALIDPAPRAAAARRNARGDDPVECAGLQTKSGFPASPKRFVTKDQSAVSLVNKTM